MIDSVLPFYLSKIICCLALAYTSPTSTQRPAAVALVAICCLISVRSTVVSTIPGYVGAEYLVGFILHTNYWLCLAKLSPPAMGKSGTRIQWALNQIFNPRWSVAASNLPPFDERDPDRSPSKSSFLVQKLGDLAWTTALIYLFETYTPELYIEDFTEVSDGYLHRLSSVTPREITIRAYLSVASLAIPYLTLRAAHNIAGFLAVVCGDSPAGWRPLYGGIKEAYTMRRFYGNFWHSLMRRAFTVHALVLLNVLGLPRSNRLSRSLVIVATFMISALLHIVAAPDVPLRCSVLPQIRYYLSVAAAIFAEDLMTRLYKLTASKKSEGSKSTRSLESDIVDSLSSAKTAAALKSNGCTLKLRMTKQRQLLTIDEIVESREPARQNRVEDSVSLKWRIVGYCWVVAFSVWASSKLIYSTQQCLFTA